MAEQKGIRSVAGLQMVARVRDAVSALAEVVEHVDGHGHTTFRIRDKPFVILGEHDGRPSLSVKSDPYTQRYLVEHRGFERSRYIGQHGWVTVAAVDATDWTELAELLVDAYVLVAPKRLSRQARESREAGA